MNCPHVGAQHAAPLRFAGLPLGVLTPCPPLRICGEGGRKGSPEFPLSTSWRGGQGVRTNEGERSAVILSAAGAKDLLSPRCEGPVVLRGPESCIAVAACHRSAAPVFSSPSPTETRYAPTPHPPHPARRRTRLPDRPATRHYRRGQAGRRFG